MAKTTTTTTNNNNNNNNNNNFRKVKVEEIRGKLPPNLRRDPLGAGIWSEIESLQAGEALELPGRDRDARRIGRAVARYARERGWTVRVFSSSGNAYIVRLQ
jgi:hypothetical protein